jgi:hypothetical protein
MVVYISEVDARRAPVSLAQQWIKFGSHCWTTHEYIFAQQWVNNSEDGVG